MSNARFSILQAAAISDTRISDAQFRTLAALGRYGNKDGWCFPSLQTLGKDLNKSPQAVSRDIIALVKLGYVEKHSRFDKKSGSRQSNLYRLKFDTYSTPDVDTPSTPDVDTPSTPDVDTPSTPDVEVNALYNDTVNEIKNSAAKPPKAETPAEVKLFRDVTGKYPNRANFDDVARQVQATAARLQRDCTADDLRPFFAAWTGKGYKPVNLAWLEWAATGIIPNNQRASAAQQPAAFDAINQWLQSKGE
jgi:DNA-binding transcriptional ArsR family regulator